MMSDMLQLVVVMRWRPSWIVSDKLKHGGHKATRRLGGHKATRRLDSGLVRGRRAQVPYLNGRRQLTTTYKRELS